MIISLDTVKQQLNFTESSDDTLITLKIAAAQSYVERMLGFKIEDEYGGEDQDPVPEALQECVCQLAAHWYENREPAVIGQTVIPIPFGIADILREFRTWTF